MLTIREYASCSNCIVICRILNRICHGRADGARRASRASRAGSGRAGRRRHGQDLSSSTSRMMETAVLDVSPGSTTVLNPISVESKTQTYHGRGGAAHGGAGRGRAGPGRTGRRRVGSPTRRPCLLPFRASNTLS